MENVMQAKALVIYYSLDGHSKRAAEAEAQKTGAEIYAVESKKKRGKLWAMFKGCPAAMGFKQDKGLKQIDIDFDLYDDYTVIVPLWAGSPAPAFNNIIELMPKFKKVKVVICSAGGESHKAKEKIEGILRQKELILTDYQDIK
jgi:flavodoxin